MEMFGVEALTTTSWPVLFFTAFVFGGLHGLEPGHSKTLMAAFIIAVRGTVAQAIALGLAAAASHSIIVWVLGLSAAYFGEKMVPEDMEAWFVLASGIIIMGIGGWMLLRLLLQKRSCGHSHDHHDHDHDHNHGHSHAPHAHSHHDHNHHDHSHSHHKHDHHGHSHEHAGHGAHSHADGSVHSHDDMSPEEMDAHARFHAEEIKTKFASGRATMGQTILFGLSGGLIPCPAAITVLILCLHLNQLWLGFVMVSAFSIGLAVTMVTIGVVSAVGVRTIRNRTSRFDEWFAKAPYLSGVLIITIGAIMLISGLKHVPL
jgi:nickel/cobalt exporter